MKYLLVVVLFTSYIIVDASDNSRNINIPTNNRVQNNAYGGYRSIGGNIFVGTGWLDSNISEFFTNPVFIGINIEFLRNRFVIQIDDYIGFSKTRKTMIFTNDHEWSANKFAYHFTGGGNIGYTIMNSNIIKFVPLTGIGLNLLSSTFLTSSDNSRNEPFLPYYKIGCYIDIKEFKLFRYHSSFNYAAGYTCIRLSIGLNSPIGNPRYDSFYKGSLVYFTIGMGGVGG